MQREKWLVFRWHERMSAMRAKKREATSILLCVIATLSAMSYDSLIRVAFSFCSPLNCVYVFITAIGRLQNIGHFENLYVCVQRLDFILKVICMHAQCKSRQ